MASRLSKPILSLIAGGASAALIAMAFVPEMEGTKLAAYQDQAKIWTICTGHTGGVYARQRATKAECDDWLASDLGRAFAVLDRHVKIDLPEPTRAALASFVFNVGEGSFMRSSLLKKLNAGDIEAACNELPRWVYAGGNQSQGLVRRRELEREICLEGLTPRQQLEQR